MFPPQSRTSRKTPPATIAVVTMALLLLLTILTSPSLAFAPTRQQGFQPFIAVAPSRRTEQDPHHLSASSSDAEENDESNTANDEAARLQQQAERLRQQIRDMEASLGDEPRPRNYEQQPPPTATLEQDDETEPSLRGKRVLVAGANGRLGSMVCRYLLRQHPQTEVVAATHIVSENSPTARGYGRLAYEVGAEDGVGTLGAAWSEERDATFQWTEDMRDYNLQNLRLVECELLDPTQCRSVMEGCDAVIWCATDFNGNQPRAVSGFNVAFLFRAVTVPDKGRVEIEGLKNILGALKQERTEREQQQRQSTPAATTQTSKNKINNFVLVSTAPEALPDFETPFGNFIGLKRQGEQMMLADFPSLSSVALQMSKYEDNFVEEGKELQYAVATTSDGEEDGSNDKNWRRKINRRDAARAAVDALTMPELGGKVVQVWTAS